MNPSGAGHDRAVDVPAILRSARFYFWPVIALNVLAMTRGAGGDYERMAWFALVIAVMSSFGFLVNDLFDRRIDLANAAGHFERSNRPTIRTAWVTAGAFAGAGLGVAAWLGSGPFLIAAASGGALAAYSPLLRRVMLLPNVITALLAAGPLWTPLVLAASAGAPWQWWLASGIVGILIAREVLMDVRDRHGDQAGGRPTLATHLGARAAAIAGFGLTVASLVPLAASVVLGSDTLSRLLVTTAATLAAAIALLLLRPAARIITTGASTPSIQTYVSRSRLAMLLLAGLTWILSTPA
jgi:4-hydroxybenzoate polyprenyltransferase